MYTSIRNIIVPVSRASASFAFRPSYRSVGYLHRGARVRGLVRDEADYLTNPKGLTYGASEESLASIKTLLGSHYALPDDISLQVITHKSFAHGKKPFNEKLAVLGSHFLKYRATIYTITQEGLGNIGSQGAKDLIAVRTLSRFVEEAALGDAVFWKKRDPLQTDSVKSGQQSVYARTAEALVGAILLNHGKEKADKFVTDVLLNGDKSLVQLSKAPVQETVESQQ